MLDDVKKKIAKTSKDIEDNARIVKKTIRETASSATSIAKETIDSVVIKIATQIIIKSMKSTANRSFTYINNDKKYQNVIDRTWELLPLPVRLVGKDSLDFNNNMFFVRDKIFGKDTKEPTVDDEDKGFITNLVNKMFK